jgi:hypothetical protein
LGQVCVSAQWSFSRNAFFPETHFFRRLDYTYAPTNSYSDILSNSPSTSLNYSWHIVDTITGDDIWEAHRVRLIKPSSTSVHKSFATEEVCRANVKMSHMLTVFLCLLINTRLKKQTIFINALRYQIT